MPQRPGFPGNNGFAPGQGQFDENASAVDDLISSVVKESEAKAANGTPEPATGKKAKKADKNTRLVYSDNETSPEEKMARLSRYAFTREKEQTVLGEVGGAVTGVVMGQDTVVDKAA